MARPVLPSDDDWLTPARRERNIAPADLDLAGCERFLRRNGLPLFVVGHTAKRDVFGRAAPFLAVVLILELFGTMKWTWAWWGNTLAVIGAAIVVGGVYVLLNFARGRRWNTLPQDVGTGELAVFVLAPGVAAIIVGGQLWRALIAVAVNLVLVGLSSIVVRYGILASAWWGLARLADELGASLLRLIRLLPLLLVFSIVLFYTTEVWQVFDQTPTLANYILGGFFTLLILALVGLRVRGETRNAWLEATQNTVASNTVTSNTLTSNAIASKRCDATRLTRNQRANLTVMIAVSQLLQVLVVSAGIGIFFVVLGVLTITEGTMESWAITGGTLSLPITLGDAHLVLSATLLRVSAAIATFTGLYYAISVQVDPTYRDEFADGMVERLSQVIAVRRRYASLLGPGPAAT